MTADLTPQRGVLRAVRGTALALTCALLTVAAHVASGGQAPDGVLLTLLTLAVAAAGTALADRRRGPGVLLCAVGTTQVLLHVLLTGLDSHHHAVDVPVMTVAHAAAAVVSALLLAGAEAALFAVAAAWQRVAAAVPLRQPAPLDRSGPTGLPAAPTAIPAPVRILLTTLLARRGPPAFS